MVEMLRTYDLKRKQPVFELDTIHFRDNAIFHDILPGFAEHRLLMGLPIEAKLYEGIKNILPTTKAGSFNGWRIQLAHCSDSDSKAT